MKHILLAYGEANKNKPAKGIHFPTLRHKVLFYGGCVVVAGAVFFQIILGGVGILSRSFDLFLLTPLVFLAFGVSAIWASGVDAKTARRTIADLFFVFPY